MSITRGNFVRGRFFTIDPEELMLHRREYFRAPDMHESVAAFQQLDRELALVLESERLDHILMPTSTFAKIYQAFRVHHMDFSRFAGEYVEYVKIPNKGLHEFNVIAIPVGFSRATILVYIIPDDLYDLVSIEGEAYQFVSDQQLYTQLKERTVSA